MNRPSLALLLACLATAASAEDIKAPNLKPEIPGTPGAVATLALAQNLYALGLQQKDALTVLTAARLAASVDARPVERKPETKDKAARDQPGSARPVDAGAMLATARALAGEDDLLLGLVEDAGAETARTHAGRAATSTSHLPGGMSDVWTLPFYGDSTAELAILGNGATNLDVLVTDENGNPICADTTASDKIYCDFVPSWNGYFTVTVQNHGAATNAYTLATN